MEYDVKPMKTQYKQMTFRSRLESHWAFLFDTMGLIYVYEPQGYAFGDATYLPDFFIPEWNVFVEIKPQGYREHDERHRKLSTIGNDVVLFAGYPRIKVIDNGNDFKSVFTTTVYKNGKTIVDYSDATLADDGDGYSLMYHKSNGMGYYRFNGNQVIDTPPLPTIGKRILYAYDRESQVQFLGGKDGKTNYD